MTFAIALFTALWLGILTSISPCPLATNIAAVTFISKRFNSRSTVLMNGLLYTLGRTLTYSVLGFLIIKGLLSIPNVSMILQDQLAKFLGPILILVGMFLLDLLHLPSFGKGCGCSEKRITGRWYASSLWLGILFAFAFCPASAAIFFGALIPLALDKDSTIGMPVLYGIGTGIPVIVFAFLMASGFTGLGKILQNVAKFELWVRRITGVIFILIGIYYILAHIFGVI